MSSTEKDDPLLDALIEAYLINENEIIEIINKNDELAKKLRENGVKIPSLGV